MRLHQRCIFLGCLLPQALPSALTQTNPPSLPYSEWMATSIISRSQGIATGRGGRSESLQAGFTQKAFRQLLESNSSELSSETRRTIAEYVSKSVESVVPLLSNATNDVTSFSLDRLSNGNNLLTLYKTTKNKSYLEALQALRKSVDLQPRNQEGGLWYWEVYREWSYLDGMYSFAPFFLDYAYSELADPSSREQAAEEVIRQLELLWEHCYRDDVGLVVHGYDDSLSAVWVNTDDPKRRGASPHVWGRSLGWYMMALVDTLEFLMLNTPTPSPRAYESLLPKFQSLSAAILEAVDPKTGGWFQILDEPNREGNYIESSGSAMFVYSSLKGARLGLLWDEERYVDVATRAYQYIVEKFVILNDTDGTLGYNGTVGVCSLNSTATFEYYVGQPIEYNSVLGTGAFVVASVEFERLHSYNGAET
ncbi:hypothetical protein PM082_018824 [Marasmius tenuissimus]|nr:hypothetical protein PM082_018824 [Marasmius tenuissimus]